jgi:hypothetical protein
MMHSTILERNPYVTPHCPKILRSVTSTKHSPYEIGNEKQWMNKCGKYIEEARPTGRLLQHRRKRGRGGKSKKLHRVAAFKHMYGKDVVS